MTWLTGRRSLLPRRAHRGRTSRTCSSCSFVLLRCVSRDQLAHGVGEVVDSYGLRALGLHAGGLGQRPLLAVVGGGRHVSERRLDRRDEPPASVVGHPSVTITGWWSLVRFGICFTPRTGSDVTAPSIDSSTACQAYRGAMGCTSPVGPACWLESMNSSTGTGDCLIQRSSFASNRSHASRSRCGG